MYLSQGDGNAFFLLLSFGQVSCYCPYFFFRCLMELLVTPVDKAVTAVLKSEDSLLPPCLWSTVVAASNTNYPNLQDSCLVRCHHYNSCHLYPHPQHHLSSPAQSIRETAATLRRFFPIPLCKPCSFWRPVPGGLSSDFTGRLLGHMPAS